jgi:hypothetical protein
MLHSLIDMGFLCDRGADIMVRHARSLEPTFLAYAIRSSSEMLRQLHEAVSMQNDRRVERASQVEALRIALRLGLSGRNIDGVKLAKWLNDPEGFRKVFKNAYRRQESDVFYTLIRLFTVPCTDVDKAALTKLHESWKQQLAVVLASEEEAARKRSADDASLASQAFHQEARKKHRYARGNG